MAVYQKTKVYIKYYAESRVYMLISLSLFLAHTHTYRGVGYKSCSFEAKLLCRCV